MSVKFKWAGASGGALRSDSAHTSCSFKSDSDIKQEPLIQPSSSGKHSGRLQDSPSSTSHQEHELLPSRLADARTWLHAAAWNQWSPLKCVGDSSRRINIWLWICQNLNPETWCLDLNGSYHPDQHPCSVPSRYGNKDQETKRNHEDNDGSCRSPLFGSSIPAQITVHPPRCKGSCENSFKGDQNNLFSF